MRSVVWSLRDMPHRWNDGMMEWSNGKGRIRFGIHGQTQEVFASGAGAVFPSGRLGVSWGLNNAAQTDSAFSTRIFSTSVFSGAKGAPAAAKSHFTARG